MNPLTVTPYSESVDSRKDVEAYEPYRPIQEP